ncbi:MAG: DNA primase, partial [Oscillospiraceae bacterium]
MSEVQTVSAAIHEVAHSLLHNREIAKDLQAQQGENLMPNKPKNRNTEEVEAESISFAVCSYYGIQTAENSLGYIASWSKGKELAELRASLEIINKTSSEVITGIDTHFAEIVKERGIDLTTEASVPEQAPDLNKGQITEDGYNIEVDGHIGTWYVIDTEVVDSTKYFLLEHEEHGDGAACVIMDSDGKLVLDDVWNGFNDLKEHFERRTAEEQRIDEPIQHDYPMPDPTVSIDDRNTYGYTSDELLPLSKERAAELWELDLTVYLLYEDNTEAMAFDREDIDNHD